MKKINLILVLTLLSAFFLSSCQSIKDGLSGKKSENSDEFLVQKKNPLVTPPDFMKLPKPKDAFETEASSLEDETDIKKLLEMDKSEDKIEAGELKNVEDFVLKNIKK